MTRIKIILAIMVGGARLWVRAFWQLRKLLIFVIIGYIAVGLLGVSFWDIAAPAAWKLGLPEPLYYVTGAMSGAWLYLAVRFLLTGGRDL